MCKAAVPKIELIVLVLILVLVLVLNPEYMRLNDQTFYMYTLTIV